MLKEKYWSPAPSRLLSNKDPARIRHRMPVAIRNLRTIEEAKKCVFISKEVIYSPSSNGEGKGKTIYMCAIKDDPRCMTTGGAQCTRLSSTCVRCKAFTKMKFTHLTDFVGVPPA